MYFIEIALDISIRTSLFPRINAHVLQNLS